MNGVAHHESVRRTLFLESSGDGELHIVSRLEVPDASGKQALFLSVGLNPQRSSSNDERDTLIDVLGRRALDGVALVVGTSTVAFVDMEPKLAGIAGDRPLELMLHGVEAIPSDAIDIRVRVRAGGEPLRLVVVAGNRPVLRAAGAIVRNGAFSAEIRAGGEVRFALPGARRSASPTGH